MRTRAARPGAGHPERGAVTAELAVALPAIVLMLLATLVVASAGITQLRVADAARAAARSLAIGETEATSAGIVSRLAGETARMNIATDSTWVTVTVKRPVVAGWFSAGPLTASASATALVEP